MTDLTKWRMVPVEAVREMLDAVHFGPNCAEEKMSAQDEQFWIDVWNAMLAAAPAPPVVEVTDEACEIVWWYRIEHQNPSATAPMVAREWLTAWQRELGPTLGLVEIREPSDDECRDIWREAKANEGDGSKVCAGRAMFNACRAVMWPKEGL